MMEYEKPTKEQLDEWVEGLDTVLDKWGEWISAATMPRRARELIQGAQATLMSLRDAVMRADLAGAWDVLLGHSAVQTVAAGDLMTAINEAKRVADLAKEPEQGDGDEMCVLVYRATRRTGYYIEPSLVAHGTTIQQFVLDNTDVDVDRPFATVLVNGRRVPAGRILRLAPIGDINLPDWPGDVVEIR